MLMKSKSAWLAILVVMLFVATGCSDDDNPTEVETETGVIRIDPSPGTINAPWVLSGPDAYTGSGSCNAPLYFSQNFQQ